MPSPYLLLCLLVASCFSLAAQLEVRRQEFVRRDIPSAGVLDVLMGDSRRLFANHFFVKADVYFHSGYYPTIFDAEKVRESSHLMEEAKTQKPDHHSAGTEQQGAPGHDEAGDFLGRPKDWIDAFGRHFFPSRHTHLDEAGEEREILPWLRLSAELDPQRAETYVVAAFWLRTRLGQVDEAEKFLREGWTASRDSYEILFELGRLYYESRRDPARARNVWELALQKWKRQESNKPEPDTLAFLQITGHLARLEEREGDFRKAVSYLEMLRKLSPFPAEIQKQIDEVRKKIVSPSSTQRQSK